MRQVLAAASPGALVKSLLGSDDSLPFNTHCMSPRILPLGLSSSKLKVLAGARGPSR